MKKQMLLIIVLLGSVLTFSEAFAMRCGTKLVHERDSQVRVLKTCGQPEYKHTYYREVLTGYPVSYREHQGFTKDIIAIDEWYYDFGPSGFLYTLIFENGTLVDIETERSQR